MKKTIKIIDIFIKIANGEEVPVMVRMNGIDECEDIIFLYDKDIQDYKSKDEDYLFEIIFNKNFPVLNLEVEILEEDKKIEKLTFNDTDVCCVDGLMKQSLNIKNKINEIIDRLEELEKGE